MDTVVRVVGVLVGLVGCRAPASVPVTPAPSSTSLAGASPAGIPQGKTGSGAKAGVNVDEWPMIAVDHVCAVRDDGGHALRVENECTCGERPVCEVEPSVDEVRVSVREDARHAPLCRDCYPSGSTCSVPRLAPGAEVKVIVNGVAVGTMQVGANGLFAAGQCL